MAQSIIDEIAGVEEPILDDAEEVVVPDVPAEEVEDQSAESKPKTVPLAALLEERSKGKDFRDELTATRERMAKMETLFGQLQSQRGEQGSAEQIPSYDDDPDGNLRGTIAQLQQRLETFEGKSKQQDEQAQAQTQERELLDRYATAVRTFSAEHADFQDSYAYLAKTADAELQARGYDDPQERASILLYEEGQMVGRAMRDGKNPAEVLYGYATHRGYKANGAESEDKLDRLRKGAEASKSLSSVGGNREGVITLERLAELEGADFDREWAKAQRSGLLG